MHKKLLLVMLIPILALSLIVVGCGGDDDDDLFEGAATFRGFQGTWTQEWSASAQRPPVWFIATANQLAIMDINAAEGGLNFRTGFTEIAATEIRDTTVPGSEVQHVNHAALHRAMWVRLAEMHNPDSPYFVGAGRVPGLTVTMSGGMPHIARGFGGTTITNLGATISSFVGGQNPVLNWTSIGMINDSLFNHVSYRGFENFFRNLIGVNFHPHFHHATLINALVPTANNAVILDNLGFLPGTFGQLPAGNTALFRNPNDPDTPQRVVPFEWTLYDWDSSELVGSLHGIWIDGDGTAGDEVIVILGTRHPDFWQTHMPLPLGIFTRGTP